mgnify:CR=1 FL=1
MSPAERLISQLRAARLSWFAIEGTGQRVQHRAEAEAERRLHPQRQVRQRAQQADQRMRADAAAQVMQGHGAAPSPAAGCGRGCL